MNRKKKKQEEEAKTNLGSSWSDDSWKLICIDQSTLYNFSHSRELKNV